MSRESASHAPRHEFQQLLDLAAKCSGVPTEETFGRLLGHIKSFLKGHDERAPMTVEMLLAKMRDPAALVRINLVRIVDTLFLRSKAFRAALLPQLHVFLQFAVGIGPGASATTPKPPLKAKELQQISIAAVRQWDDTFGDDLKLLRMGAQFMQVRVGGTHVPSQMETEREAESRRAMQMQRTQRLLAVRYARLVAEFAPQERDLQHVLSEIDNAIEMLFPSDAQQLGEYMMQTKGTEDHDAPAIPATKEEQPEEPSAKKQRRAGAPNADRSSSSASAHSTAAASTTAASASGAPGAASPLVSEHFLSADEEIEWETDQQAPSSSSSVAAAAPAALSSAVSASASAAPAAPLEGAAAVFGEFASAPDSHWWLDEHEANADDSADPDDEDAAAAALSHSGSQDGLTADYSLSIEFDANLGSMENADNALLFDALRDGLARLQKSFLPLLNEWIDTLQRIDVEQLAAPDSAAASSSAAAAVSPSFLSVRAQRDSYLLRCVSLRDQIRVVQSKCARLNVHSSSLAADRSDLVRRETERRIVAGGMDEEETDEQKTGTDSAAPGSSIRASAAAAAASALDTSAASIAAATRHAAELVRARAAAEKRATKKIVSVKRKHAKEMEARRVQSRHPVGVPSTSPMPVDPLRRSFSGKD